MEALARAAAPERVFFAVVEASPRLSYCIAQKVLITTLCRSQLSHKSVNLSFAITNMNGKFKDLCGDWPWQNEFKTLCVRLVYRTMDLKKVSYACVLPKVGSGAPTKHPGLGGGSWWCCRCALFASKALTIQPCFNFRVEPCLKSKS